MHQVFSVHALSLLWALHLNLNILNIDVENGIFRDIKKAEM